MLEMEGIFDSLKEGGWRENMAPNEVLQKSTEMVQRGVGSVKKNTVSITDNNGWKEGVCADDMLAKWKINIWGA